MNLKEIKLEPLLDTLTLTKIPDEIYFSEKYSKYVSNSRLGKLNPRQGGSPEQFFAPFVQSGYSSANVNENFAQIFEGLKKLKHQQDKE